MCLMFHPLKSADTHSDQDEQDNNPSMLRDVGGSRNCEGFLPFFLTYNCLINY